MNRICVKLNLVFLSLLFVCDISFASLTIKPAVINVTAEKNAMCEGVYSVTNPDENEVIVRIKKEDWKNSYDNDSSITMADWMIFEKDEYIIEPGKTVEIPFKILTDEKMSGSVSGRVLFTTIGGMIQMQVRAPVYMTIMGTENIAFEIEDLNLLDNLTEPQNIFYTLTLKNTGNIHIRHSGIVEIYDKKMKNLIKTIEIPETLPTYSHESRAFSERLISKKDLGEGKYIALFKINALEKEVKKVIKFKINKKGNLEVDQKK